MIKRDLRLCSWLLGLLASLEVAAFDWQAGEGCRWAALPVAAFGRAGFTELPVSHTGILFTNWLPEERYLTNQILLNGSGVAAGDVDGDGRCDLFFCGIDRPCALYRNLGDFKFADITAEAGVACAGQHSSGAVFADVDGDGTLDLIVNGVGSGTRLFLNDGKAHFREVTARSGLRGGSGSMSAALADIDGDGYLDLYVVNYRAVTFRDELNVKFKASVVSNRYEVLEVNGRPVGAPDLVGRYTVDPATGIMENGEADVLYHNAGQGRFTAMEWTDGSFLDEDGKPIKVPYDWGLSVMFRDLNRDGAPDIYVCNDFHSEDRIWINDGQGRFHAIPRLALRQTSLFSMGIDFADIDRDGYDDFFVADMLSRRHASRQLQLMDRGLVQLPVGAIDNRPQYSRNTLFWNRGDTTFAEIAQLAGVEASEWTWCPVFMDVDLDGYEDLLMVTGHLRDAQNIEISRRIDAMKRQKPMSKLEQLSLRKLFKPLDVPNLAFRNRGDLTFEEVGAAWGFAAHGVSQGIALADLNNDGGLDVIVNCLNGTPLILRNNSNRPRVAVRLRGRSPNTQGIGARIEVLQNGLPIQNQEVICGGRYLSADDPMRVFAAAGAETELTIRVHWRSGQLSVISPAKANRIYEIDEAQARPEPLAPSAPPEPQFRPVNLKHEHTEQAFDDYQRQPLLPFKLSQLGPGVSWFDVDGDGWEDLIVPSGRGGRLAVFRNDGRGGFARLSETAWDESAAQDQTAALGWAAGDRERYLLVGSSNYEEPSPGSPAASVYDLVQNKVRSTVPAQPASTGPLALADVFGEGKLDLFVGGRVVPTRFPEPASSLFCRNRAGTFEPDAAMSKALDAVGLVSGAIWSDLDSDGLPELILACAGGAVRVFHLQGGIFKEVTEQLGLSRYLGFWNSVTVGDFDGDGRLDIVAGNWGRNTKYQSYLAQPIHFYYGDLDGHGSVELIEAYYAPELNKIVPWRDWETLSAAMPFIREQFRSFSAFSTASVNEFMGDRLRQMQDLVINTLDSMVFLNRGDHFEARSLPVEAQISPVFGLAVGDLDGDGHEDIFLSQNFFEVSPLTSRLDAGRGVWLKGDGRGGFTAVSGRQSGLIVWGEGRGVALGDYDHDGRVDVLAAQNGNSTLLFKNTGAKPGLRVVFHGPAGNPQAIGATLRLQYADGRLGPAREVHAGGGYWCQDAATQVMGLAATPESVIVRWPGGGTTKCNIPAGALEIRIAQDQ